MDQRAKAVVIISGGLDSTVLAYSLRQAFDLHLISFNYGQRHKTELEYAARTAKKLGAQHDIIDLTSINQLVRGSALTSPEIEVPQGHYAQDNMAKTVVPNRNAIMLSMAYGAAVADGAKILATAVHAGDHFIYPDCRPDFINALNKAFKIGNDGFGDPELVLMAPFVNISKADIVELGVRFGVPFEDTWSCYQGGTIHCGTCGTCVERLESFAVAGVTDPSEYADREYWRSAIREFQLANAD